MNAYRQLKTIFKRIYHLYHIEHVLSWDEAVMMPEGAGNVRGQVVATLNRLIQKTLIQKKMTPLLDAAKLQTDLSAWDKANLQWMEKKHHLASVIPLKLTEQLTEAAFASQQLWRKLRAENNWHDFVPALEKTFSLTKEMAERKSQVLGLDPYDTLLDEYAPGFNQHTIDQTFAHLKETLPSLVKQIVAKQSKESNSPLKGPFAISKQKNLILKVVKDLGFSFANGRMDESHHPFSGGDGNDTRMTTRYKENEFLSALFGACHETGHSLYEQGLPKKWTFQPVGHVNSMAIHESQSLLIEMEVCRSQAFFDYVSPLIQQEFGIHEAFSANNLFKLMTKVHPSLIRVDADEVTYPLHIILRFEIEKELLNGTIQIKDLPTRWNELMVRYLDISTEGNDKDGVMQDVHWPCGAFGYFPAYTLGRIIAAQLFATFIKNHPEFFAEVKIGNFELITNWLQKNIYQYGSKLPTHQLVEKATSEPLSSTYFLNRIKERYL